MLLTIDVEEITDTNFHINWKDNIELDYEKLCDNFIKLSYGKKAIAFVLGTFAEKYPQIIKKIYDAGIEIASHGYKHNLVYEVEFDKWIEDINYSKKIIENIIHDKVKGYRSPSWSLPFEKRYYDELVKAGYEYSSSYFPVKTYMYGNSIDKKSPFYIYTDNGKIREYPITKNIIPFSGGFYLRIIPLFLLKYLFSKTKNTILYIHPYELLDINLVMYFKRYAKLNLDFILAFFSFGLPKNKIKEILDV